MDFTSTRDSQERMKYYCVLTAVDPTQAWIQKAIAAEQSPEFLKLMANRHQRAKRQEMIGNDKSVVIEN
jgi:hypothetical protein